MSLTNYPFVYQVVSFGVPCPLGSTICMARATTSDASLRYRSEWCDNYQDHPNSQRTFL